MDHGLELISPGLEILEIEVSNILYDPGNIGNLSLDWGYVGMCLQPSFCCGTTPQVFFLPKQPSFNFWTCPISGNSSFPWFWSLFGYYLALLGPYWALLNLIKPYWTLLNLIEPYWALLNLVEPYWALLSLIEPCWPYWALLSLTEPYWTLLSLIEPYWALLSLVEPYWTLLNLIEPQNPQDFKKCDSLLTLLT